VRALHDRLREAQRGMAQLLYAEASARSEELRAALDRGRR